MGRVGNGGSDEGVVGSELDQREALAREGQRLSVRLSTAMAAMAASWREAISEKGGDEGDEEGRR